ncbi:hypothetical protein NECAME_00445 [Necator americanus]|uniref:GON domain-containing protein n=1 Tax=Necator americanus TaxID=51031 RepID=W2T4G6_NECAM|nr:hypothetical protein NECAME_00445 [Necator americanus]ETN76920.1 hypothetical protein NECAME_00445 [Necator americanus]
MNHFHARIYSYSAPRNADAEYGDERLPASTWQQMRPSPARVATRRHDLLMSISVVSCIARDGEERHGQRAQQLVDKECVIGKCFVSEDVECELQTRRAILLADLRLRLTAILLRAQLTIGALPHGQRLAKFVLKSCLCVDACARGEQHRRVYCVNNAGKRAAPRMCNAVHAPPSKRPCDISKCPYEWVPGPWNTCSKTCGKGTQFRFVECRVKTPNTTKYGEPAVPKEKCDALPMPIEAQECDLNACESEFQWQIGPWGTCSQTCGQGVRRRKVRCYSRQGVLVSRSKCEQNSPRPRRTQTLIYPHTCPFNGERNDSCQCSDDGDANAGLTHFRKVRVDLLNRKINSK